MTATDRAAFALVEDGLVHHRGGRLQEARARYEAALARMPRHADALHLLGVIAMQEQRHADALDLIGRAIEISPQAAYFDNLGNALRSWGKLEAAVESYEQALALDPNHFRAHNDLGMALLHMRLPAAAASSFGKAVQINAQFAEAHSNLGNVLRELGDAQAAETHCRRAIALQPMFGEAYNNLGNALKTQRKLAEAAACYVEAQRLLPQEPQVALNLGIVLRETGEHKAAIEAFRRAIALRPAWGEAWSNLLFTLSFAQDVAPKEYLDEALAFGEVASQSARPFKNWLVDRMPGAPLRIGFVSGDFRTHPVGFFLESVLAHLDPSRVRLVAYSTRPYEDALTQRLKPRFTAWRSLVGLTDEAAATMIRNDGVHILFDMSGHTDANRLPVFAWKPAPVQVSWIGYFASTGLSAIDYVLGDEWVLPQEEAAHFIERPWRLPHGYLCFTPPEPAVPIDTADPVRPLTFGCFSDLVKVNDRVVAAWSRILSALPGARLFLKAQQLADEAQRTAIVARFGAHGVAADRLSLEGPSSRDEYLAAYNRVDISLSPFPYPGGTTTAESLWMGVPVLCRHGDRFLGHLCESVVQSVDLGDWIARDDDDYVAKAVAFASDRAALAALRGGLRERVLASALCTPERFARTLEAQFAAMWRAH
ncbi:glycosyltransferase [Trinickia dabaoshanensis]|uniref:protein O-GlcNAc transferase n=1 Tax=Trinickia dabaoshanensis TaxID=564714 RepID=A0A2N7VZG4_9BURK|nr:tetratricopeptide repeat protein [Trinickia dabaoshanensis]PMS22527.1 glycosyltransferase [Trinickia dabaoshanensis]